MDAQKILDLIKRNLDDDIETLSHECYEGNEFAGGMKSASVSYRSFIENLESVED